MVLDIHGGQIVLNYMRLKMNKKQRERIIDGTLEGIVIFILAVAVFLISIPFYAYFTQ